MPKYLLIIAAIIIIPLSIWAERAFPNVWNNRLATPFFTEEPNRHTPRYTDGQYVLHDITQDTTLSGLVIIPRPINIAKNISVTISPGTTIAFHEFAGINVYGNLTSQGTATNPVSFISNEVHPANQIWTGITFHSDSRGNITHTHFTSGSPAISCLQNSTVNITNSNIHQGSMGIYNESNSCQISNTKFRGLKNDVVVPSSPDS